MTSRRELRERERQASPPEQPLTRRELRERATATLPAADRERALPAAATEEPLHVVAGPAVLRDAPVLPALRPLAEIEAEIVPHQRSGHRAIDHPVGPEPAVVAVVAPTLAPAPAVPASAPAPAVAVPTTPAWPDAPARPGAPAPTEPAGWTRSPAPVPVTRPAGVVPTQHLVPRPDRQPDVLVRPPSPWQATAAAWAGVASIAVWAVGPVALGLGGWALLAARRAGHGLGRPVTALVGGGIGTALGAAFLAFGL